MVAVNKRCIVRVFKLALKSSSTASLGYSSGTNSPVAIPIPSFHSGPPCRGL